MKPLGDRVLIRPKSRQTQTESGILLPEQTAWEPDQIGEVVQLGYGRLCCAKHCIDKIQHEVSVGDTVLFSPESGQEITIDDERLIVMKESDILAVIGGDNEGSG